VAELCVGAAILVKKDVFVMQGQNTSDRLAILGSDANPNCGAKTPDQVSKPVDRLWGKLLPAPREHEQMEKFLYQ
jgi:hypothetical protein